MSDSFDAQNLQTVVTNLQDSVLALQNDSGSIRDMTAHMQGSLQSLVNMLSRQHLQADEVMPFTMTAANETRIDRHGRRFIMIFTPVGINSIAANVVGVTGYSFNLAPGWNPLNMPDGTILKAPTGTNQAVIIKATNWPIAGAN